MGLTLPSASGALQALGSDQQTSTVHLSSEFPLLLHNNCQAPCYFQMCCGIFRHGAR